jgi:hypothetical protein
MSHYSFSGVKQPGRGADHPPLFNANIKERVQLYFCYPSEPSLSVLGRAVPLRGIKAHTGCRVWLHCIKAHTGCRVWLHCIKAHTGCRVWMHCIKAHTGCRVWLHLILALDGRKCSTSHLCPFCQPPHRKCPSTHMGPPEQIWTFCRR